LNKKAGVISGFQLYTRNDWNMILIMIKRMIRSSEVIVPPIPSVIVLLSEDCSCHLSWQSWSNSCSFTAAAYADD